MLVFFSTFVNIAYLYLSSRQTEQLGFFPYLLCRSVILPNIAASAFRNLLEMQSMNIPDSKLLVFVVELWSNFFLQITFAGKLDYNGTSYSATGIQLSLRRLREPFLIQTFMPSIIFIFTSWISFLMQPGQQCTFI